MPFAVQALGLPRGEMAAHRGRDGRAVPAAGERGGPACQVLGGDVVGAVPDAYFTVSAAVAVMPPKAARISTTPAALAVTTPRMLPFVTTVARAPSEVDHMAIADT